MAQGLKSGTKRHFAAAALTNAFPVPDRKMPRVKSETLIFAVHAIDFNYPMNGAVTKHVLRFIEL